LALQFTDFMEYPVLEILDQLKAVLKQQSIGILQAPPGAGKSTILPLELIDESWLKGNKIIMLEPRRLAAKSVATRMSQLRNEEIGQSIGYRIRFESRVSNNTKLEVVTEGILTRMIQTDNALENVGLVIFDEFHERSLNADLALALCLQVQQVLRPDLKILIMSATLDSEKISQQLSNAPIITSTGKQYPVEHRYVPAEANKPIAPQTVSVVKKAFRENLGDLLVFLPGAGEINKAYDSLVEEISEAEVFKLYGDLNFHQQQKAILPHPQGKRKIILSTSIAETSLTIEGITVVVDCGLSRVPRFDPRSGMTKLETIRVSKDSADQRAGRAGRLGPGVCYRLWTEFQTNQLQPTRKPEILEADLAPLVLELLQWGVNDVQELKWIDAPPKGAVASAISLLEELDAVEQDKITKRGKEMASLPTHPRIAHLLLLGRDMGATHLALACDVAALLEERDPLSNEAGADLCLRVEILQQFRINDRTKADRNSMERIDRLAFSWKKWFNLTPGPSPKERGERIELTSQQIHDNTGLLLAAAYPERIAKQQKKQGNIYKLSNGRTMKVDQHDPLVHYEWLAVAQADLGMNEGKIFLAAPLDASDLKSIQKEYDVLRWDEERELVVSMRESRVGGLILKATPSKLPVQEKVNQILFEQIRLKGLSWAGWDESQEQFQARVLSLQKWRPAENWPDVSTANLLETMEEWLSPFLLNVYKKSDLVKLDWNAIAKSVLNWDQQNKLDQLAPTRIDVPSGSSIKLDYFLDGKQPELSVRLQEIFGWDDTPTVNDGKTKILIHLLSPGYKPVQITQDLKSFWDNAYHEVRKELKSRYPKHSWPEDPWTAEAVRGARKRK
jgi:ATP-dependent helicase HrpB